MKITNVKKPLTGLALAVGNALRRLRGRGRRRRARRRRRRGGGRRLRRRRRGRGGGGRRRRRGRRSRRVREGPQRVAHALVAVLVPDRVLAARDRRVVRCAGTRSRAAEQAHVDGPPAVSRVRVVRLDVVERGTGVHEVEVRIANR